MSRKRTTEDLLNPDRVFYQMVKDYTDGRLTFDRVFYRARVERVSTTVGELEAIPPSPAGSIIARVYTYGMDANFPRESLNVFYPFFSNTAPPLVGEHVYIIWEDEAKTSGLWLTKIPNYIDVNFADPDETPRQTERTSADTFEGTSSQPNQLEIETQYSSPGLTTNSQRQTVYSFENINNSIWRGKRVLIVGDSQIAGPPGRFIRDEINNRGASYTHIEGRASWGVLNWLSGRFTGEVTSAPRQGPTIPQLISTHNPDIILIGLGGNDASGVYRRQDYVDNVRQLFQQASSNSRIVLWIGPPTVFTPDRPNFNGDRQAAADKIKQAIGESNFIDTFAETNRNQNRTADGIHFLPSARTTLRQYVLKVVNR